MTSKAVEMPPREWRREDEKGKASLYLFYHVAVFCMGWVELKLGSSLGWLAIQWVATDQAGWWNIQNPCQQNQVRDQMGHPVDSFEKEWICFWSQLLKS